MTKYYYVNIVFPRHIHAKVKKLRMDLGLNMLALWFFSVGSLFPEAPHSKNGTLVNNERPNSKVVWPTCMANS